MICRSWIDARVHRSLDFLHDLFDRNDFLAAEVAAALREDLILDLQVPRRPARSSARTVRIVFSGLPNPVSMSTMIGIETASDTDATTFWISDIVTRPMSGAPRCMLAMPAPEM